MIRSLLLTEMFVVKISYGGKCFGCVSTDSHMKDWINMTILFHDAYVRCMNEEKNENN